MKLIKYLMTAILALIMLSFTPTGKHKKPVLPPHAPFGHIQYVQEITYHAIMDSAGQITKGDIISDTDIRDRMIKYGGPLRSKTFSNPPIEAWIYDEYGDQLENDKYHANSKLYDKIIHTYYPKGDVKEIIDSTNNMATWDYTYKYDNSGNMLDSIAYYHTSARLSLYSRKMKRYDDKGKLLETFSFYNDTINPTRLTLYRYNEKEQLTETDESRIGEGGSNNLIPIEKNNFWYDAKERMIDMATYRFHEGLIKDVKTIFDSSGYRIETYMYTRNKVITGSIIKSFFTATNTMQEDRYNSDGLLTDYTISHFDSAKYLIDKGVFHINYGDSKKNDTIMLQHIVNDDHNNMVVDDDFSNEGTPLSQKSYQYTYDNTGNWIARIEYNKDKPILIIEREIGYFKE